MEADIHTLFESDFYRILDFRCKCLNGHTSKPEYSDAFSISFVRRGNFLFHVYRHSLDVFTGGILVSKPGYERTVSHTHDVPDACTIFEFKEPFYQTIRERYSNSAFLRNNDLHSILAKTATATEFLHAYTWRQIHLGSRIKLQLDQTVLALTDRILGTVPGDPFTPGKAISGRLKKNHLNTLEAAKEFIGTRFTEDISLQEIADHCHVSPFHFSRIFKTFTGYAPYQYLLGLRIEQARMLLEHSTRSVADIAYASGFNSLEHFSAHFHQTCGKSPTAFRIQNNSLSKMSKNP